MLVIANGPFKYIMSVICMASWALLHFVYKFLYFTVCIC